MGKGQELYKKAKTLIPGGTQLLSKRPEMFLPDLWPAYYDKAKGCEVWDLDGNKFIDMSYMGIGSCTLGYADDDVDTAVEEAIRKGSMCTLNAPEEVELAELMIKLHPWAEMVRYARGGGEAMSIAVRIARAYSGKDKVLFCGYHGWHDWYISANLSDEKSLDGHLIPGLKPKGVPRELANTSKPFIYNDLKGFKELLDKEKDKIGAIVVEAVRNYDPNDEFLIELKNATELLKIPFIIDEVSSGFRLNLGGAHLLYNMAPDIAVFAKGMSNGFPMAAILGKKEVMNSAQDSFISSTYWTDRIGPTAAIATIQKMEKYKVQEHLIEFGNKVKDIWQKYGEKYGLQIALSGIAPLSHFEFKHDKALQLKTLFTQEMLDRGILATTSFYSSYSHTKEHIEKYDYESDKVFELIADIISSNKINESLKGPVSHSGFKRLN